MQSTCNIAPVDTPDYRTVIRADLFKYWAEVIQDPGAPVAGWLTTGAPAGLACDMSELDPICPTVDKEQLELDVNELSTEFDSFQNYAGVDDDDVAAEALHSYRDKGYLAEFDTPLNS